LKVLSIVKPNIVLFVGDISDGSVKIIKKINEIKIPTFVILGNHDRGKDSTGKLSQGRYVFLVKNIVHGI